MLKEIYLSFLFCFFAVPAFSQEVLNFPIPTGNPKQLFFLQRNQNTNTVVYELNLKNGVLDTAKPVHVFWICYADKSQQEELTGMERKYAYGLSIKYISKDHYELRLVADKKNTLELLKDSNNSYHVYAMIDQKKVILSKIYLQIHGGSLLSPKIEYVVLTGIDPETGTEVNEKKTM